MTTPPTPYGAVFQAPTCRSLGLALEMRMRNTARRLGSGQDQLAAERLLIDLRVYRRGALVYSNERFGHIDPGATLVVRERELPGLLHEAGSEDELLLVGRVRKEGVESAYFGQEHQLVYTHDASRAQAHLLYDQQPARPAAAKATPIVFLMPKIWVGGRVSTYVVVCNTWEAEAPSLQREPVRFAVLDEHGVEVCSWEHRFFYNEAKVFDLRQRLAHVAPRAPRFFNLVGRGGGSSFVLFAIVRHLESNHFAIEHSLPPVYYMDGAIGPVRAQGCDVSLFRRGASA